MMAEERDLEQLLADFCVQTGRELFNIWELLMQRVDSSAVEPLVEMLSEIEEGSDQEGLYDLIIDLLCEIGDPRAIAPIIKVLHRIDFKLAVGLMVFSQLATPMLIDTLKSEHWQARKNAAYLLMYPRFRNEQVIPALVEVALNQDEHFTIRAEAIFALQQIGDKSVIQPLRPLRNDPNERVREATYEMLNTFQDRFSLVRTAKRLIYHGR
jgi:HEAT repeat protein